MTLLETFPTKTGITVRVRYLEPEDVPLLVDIFEHMGDESRYRRFNQPLERVTTERVWTEAENIAQAVMTNSRGLIAFADLADQPNAPVAAARYVLIGNDEAEVALSVRDDMQGQGIGKRMFQLLIEEARRAGLQRLVGSVQNENAAVWGLLRHVNLPIEHIPDGAVTEIVIQLGPVSHPDG